VRLSWALKSRKNSDDVISMGKRARILGHKNQARIAEAESSIRVEWERR
jgi:hypothetical protein